jgi:hypothetical protein
MTNGERIILDLCGGTGAWSRPYLEAGYDVRLITLPEQDVRYYHPPKRVYGVLVAPPCTDFCISGVRWWPEKDKTKGLQEALSVVEACLRVIKEAKSKFWALENPVGRLRRFIGAPRWYFQPYEFGDPWTKKTCIWGDHNIPEKHPILVEAGWYGNNSPLHRLPPSKDRAMLRSITPPGFARAFYEANK